MNPDAGFKDDDKGEIMNFIGVSATQIPKQDNAEWPLVSYARELPKPLSLICLVYATAILIAYFLKIEWAYRPLPEAPATNPLTAFVFILLSLSIFIAQGQKKRAQPLSKLLAFGAIILTTLSIIDHSIQTNITSSLNPWHDETAAHAHASQPNSMGLNTALMLSTLALAQLLKHYRQVKAAQLISLTVVAIPTVTFTGYAFSLTNFHGQMSLVTSTLGFTLGLASVAMTANHAPLKIILNPFPSGKIARLQALLSYAVPTFLGFVSVKFFALNNLHPFGVYVVLISWFFTLMACISAIYHYNAESAQQVTLNRLASASRTDSLTNIPNRRHFFEFANHELKKLNRYADIHISLMLIDVDDFKQVNDKAGHHFGDLALRHIAIILKQNIRSRDMVARIGGDEFAILLTDSNKHGAKRVAEQIRSGIEQMKIPGDTAIEAPLTVSIGISESQGSVTITELLARADKNMYSAKRTGKNRVSLIAE